MIDRLVEFFSPATSGVSQLLANSHAGIRDFGPMLESPTRDEGTHSGDSGGGDAAPRNDGTAPPEQKQPADRSSQPTGPVSATTPASTPQQAGRIAADAMGERTELVSMLWGLRANAELSYLTIDADAQRGAADAGPEVPEEAQTNPLDPGQLFTFPAVDEAAPVADWLHSLQLLPVVPGGDAESVGSALATEGNNPAHAATAASTTWPERLLRWLATSDGKGATAWIRDYQMTPSQAASMVDSIRSLAAQQGQQLHRVVLNGHELWRSASNTTEQQRG